MSALLEQAQAHLAVIDQERVLLLDRLENLRMGNGHFVRPVAGLAQHQPDLLAFPEHARTALQGAQPDLGSLQVDQDADRAVLRLRQGAQIAMHAPQADRAACGSY